MCDFDQGYNVELSDYYRYPGERVIYRISINAIIEVLDNNQYPVTFDDGISRRIAESKERVSNVFNYSSCFNPLEMSTMERLARDISDQIIEENLPEHVKIVRKNGYIDTDDVLFSHKHFIKEDKKMKAEITMKTGMFVDPVKNPKDLIKKVIFSGDRTIVLWVDGSKTVVKCGRAERFDKEKGLAMAIVKKFFGTNLTKSNFNDIFKEWC